MTFRPAVNWMRRALAAASFATALLAVSTGASADLGFALVPVATIYPGEVITAGRVQRVEVTNPNLAGDYARAVSEVDGLITTRTLLPGRTISVSSLRVPYAVSRGSNVRLVFSIGNMTISASGSPLADAAVGDTIRARNLDSGVIVSGTVMADGTIHVVAK